MLRLFLNQVKWGGGFVRMEQLNSIWLPLEITAEAGLLVKPCVLLFDILSDNVIDIVILSSFLHKDDTQVYWWITECILILKKHTLLNNSSEATQLVSIILVTWMHFKLGVKGMGGGGTKKKKREGGGRPHNSQLMQLIRNRVSLWITLSLLFLISVTSILSHRLYLMYLLKYIKRTRKCSYISQQWEIQYYNIWCYW